MKEHDTITVDNGTTSMELNHTSLLGAHLYSGSFPEISPDTGYTFSLTRISGNSAPESNVTIPTPVTITTPTANAGYSLSSGSAIEIKWENNTDDTVIVSIEGDCVKPFSTGEIADSGAFTVVGADVTPEDPTGSCTATIEVERRRAGTLDGNYSGGNIYASQKASIGLQVDP